MRPMRHMRFQVCDACELTGHQGVRRGYRGMPPLPCSAAPVLRRRGEVPPRTLPCLKFAIVTGGTTGREWTARRAGGGGGAGKGRVGTLLLSSSFCFSFSRRPASLASLASLMWVDGMCGYIWTPAVEVPEATSVGLYSGHA